MNSRKQNNTGNPKEQTNSKQQISETQVIPANEFQAFFKLEFDSLNNFVDQEMSNLKDEYESELSKSKTLLRKYRKLRQLCDKKLEFDRFKEWNDYHSHLHLKSHEPEDIEYYHRSSHSHHTSHSDQRHNSLHSRSYYDDYHRPRKRSPEYDDRRYYGSRMARDLPSSQRRGVPKRTYHDDIKRMDQFKAQHSHRVRGSSSNQKISEKH